MDLLSQNRSDTSSENVPNNVPKNVPNDVPNVSKTDEEKIIEALRQSPNVTRKSYFKISSKSYF